MAEAGNMLGVRQDKRPDIPSCQIPPIKAKDGMITGIAAGTLLTTPTGFVPVQQITAGATILGEKGQWTECTAISTTEQEVECIEIHPKGFIAMICGKDQMMPTAKAKRLFTAGEKRRMVADESSWSHKKCVDFKTSIPEGGEYGRCCLPVFNGSNLAVVDLAAWLPPSDTTKNNRGARWLVEDKFISWRKDKKVNRYFSINPAVAQFIGLFLADGTAFTKEYIRQGRAFKQSAISFTFGESKPSLIEFISRCYRGLFNADSNIFDKKHEKARSVSTSSSPGSRWLRSFYTDKGEKALPCNMLGLPRDLLLWVVRGWLLGDGNWSNTQTINGASCSRPLIEQMRYALHLNGFRPALFRTYTKGRLFKGRYIPGSILYQIMLNRGDSFNLLKDYSPQEKARWNLPNRLPKVSYMKSTMTPCVGGLAIRMGKPERQDKRHRLYQISVKRGTSFVANNIELAC